VPEYISVPIEVEPIDVVQLAITRMQEQFPGWQPNQGNLDTWLIYSLLSEAVQLREVASDVPTSIFRYFGANVLQIPPVDASEAVCDTTWTARDNLGYTIAAGTQVGIRATGDELVPFEVMADVPIPPGSTATQAGEVPIQAMEAGADGSGLGSPGGPVELIDPLDWVQSIVQVGVTTGGVDAEEDFVYLNRLAALAQLLSPRPILPNDFAVLSRSIAGVARATAIDGYNPADSSTNNERMVAVAVIDAAGNAEDATTKNAVDAYLESLREVNFIVNVIDPTYTTIDVQYSIHVLPTFDPPSTISDVDDALNGYLDPSGWGRDPNALDVDQDPTWVNNPNVRLYEVAQQINTVRGVDYIASLQIRKSGGTFGTADIVMTGIAPLPRPGTMTGTSV